MMKSKLFMSGFILFITLFSFGQVTTTISDLKVNNSPSTGITFNSNSTITAKFDVNLLTYNGAQGNILGNVHIYIKQNATSEPIQVGWSSVTFTVDYPPFVTKDTYKSKVFFTVELLKSGFLASGGVLYAEYKNNNGNKYKSSNIAISGGTMVPGNPTNPTNPGNPTNPEVSSTPYLRVTNLRYGETNEVVEDFTGDPAIGTHFTILLPKNKPLVNLNVDFEITKDSRAPSFTLCDRYISWGAQRLVGWSKPCTEYTNNVYGTLSIDVNLPDNPNKIKNFNLDPTLLGHGLTIQVVELEFLNTDIYPITNATSGDIIGIGGKAATVLAGVVFDERRNMNRPLYEPCSQYRWFKRPVGGTWAYDGTTGPDVNSITEPTEFFRRSFYKGAWVDSNIVKVLVTPPPSQLNSICCDQLFSANKPLEPIIGNTPLNVSSYTWQKLYRNAWVDIVGATSKDYTPDSSIIGIGTSFPFRRVAKLTNGEIHYSNIVKVYVNFIPTGKYAFEENENQSDIENGNSQIQIFPNPTSDVLNISGIASEITAIDIFDITGRQIKPSTLQQNDNLIQIDISNLPNATYFLSIQSPNGTIYKKIIKN